MNIYRVDRLNCLSIPCGMTSIVYIGDSFTEANKAFSSVDPGVNAWGQKDKSFGVVLSEWEDYRKDYSVILSKGIR